jgi:uncharacterized coiled-coil protein SlyX
MAGVVMVLIALAMVSGCGDKYDSAMKEQIGHLKEMNAVLAQVTDEASLEDAQPKLERISKKMKALSERLKEMGQPSDKRQAELQEKYGPELKELSKKLAQNTMRIFRMAETDISNMMQGMMPQGDK